MRTRSYPDSCLHMIVTNAAASVYNRAQYAKPGDVVQRGRSGGHYCSEPPGQAERLDAVMEQEVRSAVEDAERDDNVRLIVLTGAGQGFCARGDTLLLSRVADHGLDDSTRKRVLRPAGAKASAQTLRRSPRIFRREESP